MTLEEIINLKIDKLDKENKESEARINFLNGKIDEIESVRDKSETFVHDMADDWENISYFDMRLLTHLLVEYGEYVLNEDEVNSELNVIKLVYEAISSGLDTKLVIGKTKLVRDYIGKHMNLIMELEDKLEEIESELNPLKKESDSNRELRGNLVVLLNKISDSKNNELLNEDDFLAFYSIIEDKSISDKEKKEAIIRFTKYNEKLNDVKKMQEETQINESIYNIMEELGYNTLEDKHYIDKFKLETKKYFDSKNAHEIIDFMKEENILSKFNIGVLLSILIFGTKEIVSNTLDKIKNDKHYKLYFNSAGPWINRELINENNDIEHSMLLVNSKESTEEVKKNIEFFKSIGFLIDLKHNRMNKVLLSSNEKIVKSYDILRMYGLFNDINDVNGLGVLVCDDLVHKLDFFTEMGLLNAGSITDSPFGNYINRYTSLIATMDGNIYYHYSLLKNNSNSLEEFYDKICSKGRRGNLDRKIIPNYMKDELGLYRLIRDNFDCYEHSPNYAKYYEIVNRSDLLMYHPDILKEVDVIRLERFKVEESEYLYNINGILVSRLKALRTLTILKEKGIQIDSETVLFALINDMRLTEENYNKIAEAVGYTIERTDEDGLH